MILGGIMNSKKDWHSADIIAALKKKGTTLSALTRQSGYAPSTLSNALVRPWTKGELIIANALGIEAKRIWPSRYKKKIQSLRIKKCE
ncbi:helix-turn-helix domain-containing protein [Gilliamella sp. B2894]|nr:helix-turn-helix domain-containing protein [Gilliamella sp. B2894]MCX8693965.1 helix-turn-helix domain-containing protein [Gilliamella sp. B2881]MCX8695070.1 helix-turn-helix domain-containing protein [Gilliamella sp. B2828]